MRGCRFRGPLNQGAFPFFNILSFFIPKENFQRLHARQTRVQLTQSTFSGGGV